MGIFDWLSGLLGSSDSPSIFAGEDTGASSFGDSDINPANGLPMVGCVDIEGNAYGTDSHFDDSSFDSGISSFDDSSFDSGISSFDDSSFDSGFSSFDD